MQPSDRKAKISARVRDLRKRRSLSLRVLADHVGMPHTTLHLIERGSSVPAEYLIPLADELGVSVAYLMGSNSKQLTSRATKRAA
jgi:transcriptional regulator with XRE-family HTH domain